MTWHFPKRNQKTGSRRSQCDTGWISVETLKIRAAGRRALCLVILLETSLREPDRGSSAILPCARRCSLHLHWFAERAQEMFHTRLHGSTKVTTRGMCGCLSRRQSYSACVASRSAIQRCRGTLVETAISTGGDPRMNLPFVLPTLIHAFGAAVLFSIPNRPNRSQR